MAIDIMQALAEKQALRPQVGYNVVGVDDFGDPEDQGLFLVGSVATPEEAKQLVAAQEGDGPYYIYSADGQLVPSSKDGEEQKK